MKNKNTSDIIYLDDNEDNFYDGTSASTSSITHSNFDSTITDDGKLDNSTYFFKLPQRFDIFRNISELENIENEDLKNLVNEFIKNFKIILITYNHSFPDDISLPEITLNINEDNSVLIEWIFKDFRVGFSFESDIKHSFWYIVSNDKFDSFNSSGKLSLTNLDELITTILDFVINQV